MHKIASRAGLLLAALLTALAANAQFDNRAFLTPLAADSGQAQQLRVRAEVFFFQKDNEYFGKIADGYTLFGVTARPQVTWQPTARIKLAAGVFFRQDFGNQAGPNGSSRLQQIRPALTAVVQGDSWRFLFGSLDGHLHHGLAEPLYDFERVMLRRPEEGIQLTGDDSLIRYDVWVNWERMQYPYDSLQERLTGGLNVLVDLLGGHRTRQWSLPNSPQFVTIPGYRLTAGDEPRIGKSFGLRLPIQVTARHQGGQIDTIDRPLQTYFSAATGLRAVLRSNNWYIDQTGRHGHKGFYRIIRLEALGIGFLDRSFMQALPFPSGKGIYLNAGVESWGGTTLGVSYWRGDGYVAFDGGRLYQSVSTTVNNPAYAERRRELLILRLAHDFTLNKFGYVTTRAEPYYDLRNRRFEFSLGLYLTGLLDERIR